MATKARTATERAVLYGRISRVQGRDKKGTLQSDVEQEDETTTRAAERNMRVVAWDLDMDVSGGLFQRKGFQRALDIFRKGEADVMIVPALDRFGRDMKVIYKALEIIEDSGAYLMSIKDDIEDSRTEEGRTKIALYGMFAQIQLDRIKAGWTRAHIRHVAQGIPSRVAWGYERGPDRRLVPTAEGRVWVPRVFAWRAEGLTFPDIANRLNAAGVRTRTGRQWRKDTIGVVIANRAYLGEVAYGEELVNRDAHEALVELGIWHLAQATRGTQPVAHRNGLLSGILRCASCRYSMGFMSTKGPTGTYQCKISHAGGRCPAPVSVPAGQVEDYVRDWASRELLAAKLGVRDDGRKVAPELLHALDDAKAAIELFNADPTREVKLGTERYNAQLDRLLAHEAELEAACAWSEPGESEELDLEDLWSGSSDDQRATLRGGIDTVFVRGRAGRGRATPIEGRVHVCRIGEGPRADELPRRGDGGTPYVIREFIFPDHAEVPAGVPAVQ